MKSAVAPVNSSVQDGSWKARLELIYSRRPLRTVITHRKHYGPLLVQKSFYPEDEVCHSYLIHPPGGVVGGDMLELDIKVEANAHALVTTPAAGKFYRSSGRTAQLRQIINVCDDGVLEWLPQENIMFEGSQVDVSIRVNLSRNSRFIFWEMLCLGRPESGDFYKSGSCFQRLEMYVEGMPRLLERSVFDNSDDFRNAPWGLNGNDVLSCFVVYPADKKLLDRARDFIRDNDAGGISIGASLLEDLLICRGMASEAARLRNMLVAMWISLRSEVLGRPASLPRIWNT